MGNSPSAPPPELVYQAAKAGNFAGLQDLARRGDVLRPSDEGYVPRSQLLEWEDSQGRTALLVAAKKNHASCVDLLLQSGANVQHQSQNGKGCGSALHLAVYFGCSKDIIDLLLRFGASPFVENIIGLTPLDYGLTQRHAHIIRQFESLGLFANYLNVKTTSYLGLKSSWSVRWVAVTPRCPCPNLPANRQIFRKTIQIYPDANSINPTAALYLDGARTEATTQNGQSTVILVLHPNHSLPKGDLNVVGSSATGYRLKFQPARIVNAVQVLDHFTNAVNHFLVAGSAPQRQNPPENLFSPANNPVRARSIPPAVNPNYPVVTHSHADAGNVRVQNEPAVASIEDQTCAPSAPPLPAHDHIPPSSGTSTRDKEKGGMDAEPEEDNLCVICLCNPKEAGFVHGPSVHKCCCIVCARSVMESGNKACPVCRQEVEHVIEHFYT